MEAAGVDRGKTKARKALTGIFGANFPTDASANNEPTGMEARGGGAGTRERATDLHALADTVHKKFEAHDAMLRKVMENQQHLLQAVQQLQVQQTTSTRAMP